MIKIDAIRAEEVLVEIHATGVCHTDLSYAAGIRPAQTPAVFGHEGEQAPFNSRDMAAAGHLLIAPKQVLEQSSRQAVKSAK
jgi:Alcohol dehydrogenase GroES-like domain